MWSQNLEIPKPDWKMWTTKLEMDILYKIDELAWGCFHGDDIAQSKKEITDEVNGILLYWANEKKDIYAISDLGYLHRLFLV